MKTFDYTINDPLGFHARPAGQFAKLAKTFDSKITISANGKETDATKLIAIMGMCIKGGCTVTIKAEGSDEDKAAEEIKKFLEANF